MVLAWSLWVVGAVAVVALAARAATAPQRLAVSSPGLAAALALCAAQLLRQLAPAPTAPGPVSPLVTASWALGAVGTALLIVSVTVMLRLYRRMETSHEWLDLVSGVLLMAAVFQAVLLRPLERASGTGTGQAALALSLPALAAITLIITAVAVRTAGVAGHARSRAFVLALALLLVASGAAVAGLLGPGRFGPWSTSAVPVEQAATAAVLVALAATAFTPEPPVSAATDPLDAVMRGRLVQLVVIGALLVVDHVVGLPAVAVYLALGAMAVQLAAIALVYRLVTSLRVISRQALVDELTGLGNRRALTAALRTVDAGGAVALVTIDLDRFKEVNDVLGHAAGDDLLRQVAQRLRERGEPCEVLARQGGDEFALVLAATSAARAAARARAIASGLGEPFALAGRRVTVSASIGVAAAPEHATAAEELLQMADSAMYAAKERGGGTRVYDRATDRAHREESALAADLRRAIGTEQVLLAYQPQVCSRTAAVVGLEALVRWDHPALGVLGARTFLPVAARHGFMEALTTQVLRGALATKAALDEGGGPLAGLRLSVNVSAASLHHADLVSTVRTALAENRVAADGLVLEITETELMVDPEASRRVVAALVDLGVGVSIDDYGTGHSSLAYLRDLPASELKLDRSFVAALTSDARTADIVRTTVDLAHSLGLRLVAEGVEDAATLAALVDLGADVTQGYYHCGPLSVATLRVWSGLVRSRHPSRAELAVP